MTTPTNTSANSQSPSVTTDVETQSWWSSITSTPVDNPSDFNPSNFTEEVESASWLDLFKPRK